MHVLSNMALLEDVADPRLHSERALLWPNCFIVVRPDVGRLALSGVEAVLFFLSLEPSDMLLSIK